MRFVLFLIALSGLAPAQRPGFNLATVEQDIALGEQAAREVEQQSVVLDHPAIQAYVNHIGARLAGTLQSTPFRFRFQVVVNPEVNAFALPGGRMFINTGMIIAARSESELAAVMGHEMAHVLLRHGTGGQSRDQVIGQIAELGAQLLERKFGSDSAAAVTTRIGAQFAANSLTRKFGRNQERDADVLGVKMMAAGSFNPDAAVNFWLRQSASRAGGNKFSRLFDTHPTDESRARNLGALSQQLSAPAGFRETGLFVDFQRFVHHAAQRAAR
ncbi:MAG: M48 family metalloprotease [Bryobacteraceae bacterium]